MVNPHISAFDPRSYQVIAARYRRREADYGIIAQFHGLPGNRAQPAVIRQPCLGPACVKNTVMGTAVVAQDYGFLVLAVL